MCNFFSLISDGQGNPYFFDCEIRKKILGKELNYELDSHTSIAHFYKLKEDKMNKYEYNPLLKKFQIDQTNTNDDSVKIKEFCKKLDFKIIVPELVIKEIINPFKIKPPEQIAEEHLELLKNWASVRASVGDSVRDSVWASVWASVGALVGDSVLDSVRASVGDSVLDSVWDSVRDSVWASVRASVLDSVRASVGAYFSSFFMVEYKYDFSPVIKLWEMGLVPSFDGKIWRLHGGGKAEILWGGELENEVKTL